jgi:hypothetical protein
MKREAPTNIDQRRKQNHVQTTSRGEQANGHNLGSDLLQMYSAAEKLTSVQANHTFGSQNRLQ